MLVLDGGGGAGLFQIQAERSPHRPLRLPLLAMADQFTCQSDRYVDEGCDWRGETEIVDRMGWLA